MPPRYQLDYDVDAEDELADAYLRSSDKVRLRTAVADLEATLQSKPLVGRIVGSPDDPNHWLTLSDSSGALAMFYTVDDFTKVVVVTCVVFIDC